MGSSYYPVLIHPRESGALFKGHKLDFLFSLLTSTVCNGIGRGRAAAAASTNERPTILAKEEGEGGGGGGVVGQLVF